MDRQLLNILICPECGGELKYCKELKALCCLFDKLAYPIEDGIPIMLVEQAKTMTLEECDQCKESC